MNWDGITVRPYVTYTLTHGCQTSILHNYYASLAHTWYTHHEQFPSSLIPLLFEIRKKIQRISPINWKPYGPLNKLYIWYEKVTSFMTVEYKM